MNEEHKRPRQYTLEEVLGRGRDALITAAVREAESRTSGEIVVHIVQSLPNGLASPRDAALADFQRLGLMNTRQRNGILLFISLDERKIELVADEGIAAVIPQHEWDFAVRMISLGFRSGFPTESIVMTVAAIGDHLARHFPWQEGDVNELPDAPECRL